MNDMIKLVEKRHLKSDIPHIEVGDTVRVKIRVTERDKSNKATSRTQTFEGLVIARHGHGISESIMVRRVTYGIGVERSLPLHSPVIEDVEIVRHGKTRRAKLYFLRDRVGKRAKLRERTRHYQPPVRKHEAAVETPAAAAESSE